jgi:ubiquilin
MQCWSRVLTLHVRADFGGMMQMLNNPAVQQMMQSVMSDPALMQQMMSNNPMLQQMTAQNPAMAQMLSNPQYIRAMTDPRTLQALMQIQQGMATLREVMVRAARGRRGPL